MFLHGGLFLVNWSLQVDCKQPISASTASALPKYCCLCFAVEKAVSACKHLVEDEQACVLCGGHIEAFNKSPVPRVCVDCYEDQSRIEQSLEDAANLQMEQPVPVNQSLETPKRKALDLEPPTGGWKRQKRESEMVWFARIQSHRHGAQKRKQAEYIQQWKSFDEKHKERFREDMKDMDCMPSEEAPESAEVPPILGLPAWCAMRDGHPALVLPDGYSLHDLQRDFACYAEHPQGFDQKRWEFYGLLHQLMASSTCEIKNPSAAEKNLKSLRVNKHYLYKIRDSFASTEWLPWDVPLQFKMGRTPQASLSEREKKDLLLYVKWHQRTGTALSIAQVEDAAILMKLEKYLRLHWSSKNLVDVCVPSQTQENISIYHSYRNSLASWFSHILRRPQVGSAWPTDGP